MNKDFVPSGLIKELYCGLIEVEIGAFVKVRRTIEALLHRFSCFIGLFFANDYAHRGDTGER